jgi:hypothetical protein
MEQTGIPFGSLPGPQQAEIQARCSSQQCLSAKAGVTSARNKALAACGEYRHAIQRRDAANSTAAGFGAAAVALAIPGGFLAALVIGIILLIAAAALFVVAAIAALAAAGHEGSVNLAFAKLQDARNEFQSAVDQMIKSCSEYCFVDATLPAC